MGSRLRGNDGGLCVGAKSKDGRRPEPDVLLGSSSALYEVRGGVFDCVGRRATRAPTRYRGTTLRTNGPVRDLLLCATAIFVTVTGWLWWLRVGCC